MKFIITFIYIFILSNITFANDLGYFPVSESSNINQSKIINRLASNNCSDIEFRKVFKIENCDPNKQKPKIKNLMNSTKGSSISKKKSAFKLLLKCTNVHGYYYVAHSNDSKPIADFIYVKKGQKNARNDFYNNIGISVTTQELAFLYPDFKFNTTGVRDFKVRIKRDNGRFFITYKSKNPFYQANKKNSEKKYYTSRTNFGCKKSTEFDKFANLKADYLINKENKAREKKNKLKKIRDDKLKNRMF